MAMRLYISGPAFGLPSIDAECIAAVALLQRQELRDWQLIPTQDDYERLPLLVDGTERISGFRTIARHLQATNKSAIVSDSKGDADSIAVSSFLEANAHTLLDISLYVSFENYSTTRSAFTKILPWHTNYILPPKRRAAARARTEHLGISSIDVDNVHEDMSNRPAGYEGVGKEQKGFDAEAQQRASLLLPRKDTVRSLLRRPEHSAVFKLHALADNFFGPLQDIIGDRDYLLGGEMTNVDCLAFGYLSLMLYPKIPQDWLASTMRKKYGKLVAYVERLSKQLKLQTSVEEVVSLSQCRSEAEVTDLKKACGMSLPWSPPTKSSIPDILLMTGRELISHISTLGSSTTIISCKSGGPPVWQRYLPALLGLTAGSMGLSLYAAIRTGYLIWPHGEELHIFGRKRFADYGHLGAALAGVSLLSRQASGDTAFHVQEEAESPVLVDVEVEGQPGR